MKKEKIDLRKEKIVGMVYKLEWYGDQSDPSFLCVKARDGQLLMTDCEGYPANPAIMADVFKGLDSFESTRHYHVWYENKHNANSDVNARYYAQTSDHKWRVYGNDVTTEQLLYRHRPETLREEAAYWFAKMYNVLRTYAA